MKLKLRKAGEALGTDPSDGRQNQGVGPLEECKQRSVSK